MDSNEKGSGGLFFEPPTPAAHEPENMGFAPDLDETGPEDISHLWDALSPDTTRATVPSPSTSLRTHAATAGRAARTATYPLAEAALARLLQQHPAGDEAPRPARVVPEGPATPLAAFALGPAIMRMPPDIQRPAEQDSGPPGEVSAASRADALLEDMVDMVLVGDDDGRPEVHLSFKGDVFGGLYLRLERRDNGLFAHFWVPDEFAKRKVAAHVDDLLATLSRRGMRIAGHSLEIREPEVGVP